MHLHIFTWGLLFNQICFAWFIHFYIPFPGMIAVLCRETFGNIVVLVKACPTHLQMTFTQCLNTVWHPWNPLWKPYYSTLHNVSVIIKFVQLLFAYRSQLLTVINDDEVYFDSENDYGCVKGKCTSMLFFINESSIVWKYLYCSAETCWSSFTLLKVLHITHSASWLPADSDAVGFSARVMSI